ncbi:MAG: hypothetical protein Q8M01_17690 [Rubrivivax sp.]|nr:hypothetical protein [Rubrivivax sp.]
MKFIAIPLAFLAILAANGQAATATVDASLSGTPLTVANRLHQPPTPLQASTDFEVTGVPMRTATLPAAATPPGKSRAGLGAVQLSGVPMATATRPWAQIQRADSQVFRVGCGSTHEAMLVDGERRC